MRAHVKPHKAGRTTGREKQEIESVPNCGHTGVNDCPVVMCMLNLYWRWVGLPNTNCSHFPTGLGCFVIEGSQTLALTVKALRGFRCLGMEKDTLPFTLQRLFSSHRLNLEQEMCSFALERHGRSAVNHGMSWYRPLNTKDHPKLESPLSVLMNRASYFV